MNNLLFYLINVINHFVNLNMYNKCFTFKAVYFKKSQQFSLGNSTHTNDKQYNNIKLPS